MKIISTGNTHRIYPDDVKTSDKLEVGVYKIFFSQQSGFSLVGVPSFKETNEKIYGNHINNVNKILKAYHAMDRSMGVIFSGEKGMGKSLSMRILANQSKLPVIILDTGYPGVIEFIDSIEQEVMIFLDEFEKSFPIKHDDYLSQEDMLGLFDGVSEQKRLYVISVNETNKLSDFFMNRPGRFHYHFKFDALPESDVVEYLSDNVVNIKDSVLNSILKASKYAKFNFDILRSIAFELNLGSKIDDVFEYLNITLDKGGEFKVIYKTKDYGIIQDYYNRNMHDLLSGTISTGYTLMNKDGFEIESIHVEYSPENILVYDDGRYVLDKFHVDELELRKEGEKSFEDKSQLMSVELIPIIKKSVKIGNLI